MASYLYEAYGLVFESDVVLPGLQDAAEGRPVDVTVSGSRFANSADISQEPWLQSDNRDLSGDASLTVWRLASDGGFHIQFADGTQFTVDGSGRRVWSEDLSNGRLDEAVIYLYGYVAGLILYLRGTTILHASAINLDDKAVIFAGPSGAGKSSLATIFTMKGYPLLADDIVVLQNEGNTYRIPPAVPSLRLRPDFVTRVFGDEEAIPLVAPSWDKRKLALNKDALSRPVAPGVVYILSVFPKAAEASPILPVDQVDALAALSSLAYHNRILAPSIKRKRFDFLASFVQRVPIRSLTLPDDPEQLPSLCERVMIDAQANWANSSDNHS